jgi:hypothetical protein
MASGVMVRERGVCSAGADLLSIRNAVQIVLRCQVVKGATGRRGPGSVPLGLTLIKAQNVARCAEQLAMLNTVAGGSRCAC